MHKHSPFIREAKLAAKRSCIPVKAYQAFRSQWHSAKRRDIEFLFTIEEWWAWWQVDGRWEKRGLRNNGFVMARTGDKGPYSHDNVYCATTGQNIRDADWAPAANKHKEAWKKKTKEERASWHLAVRGDDHPRSRAVITPMGRFGSAALAAEAHGITRQGAGLRARKQQNGWRYEA